MSAFSFKGLSEKLPSYARSVKVWLFIGVVMVFVQVLLGGITRLTGSGLSITKWEIVTGTLPPLNAAQWDEAFDLYKATPQYHIINEGMEMKQFKFIYFWEYFHRLWARSMGFVFIIPFFVFLFKQKLDKFLIRKLMGVVVMAAVVAAFGWIMVASGLVERPWVNAYKLSLHLALALILYSMLLWTFFEANDPTPQVIHNNLLKKLGNVFFLVLWLQLIFGGLMSGTRAGLFYPTWPDMNGVFVPGVLFDLSQWKVENFVKYDTSGFVLGMIQFVHRMLAYLLIVIGLWIANVMRKTIKNSEMSTAFIFFIAALIAQVVLGIFTVINCKGHIPLTLGVLHQGGAVLLLSASLYLSFRTAKKPA